MWNEAAIFLAGRMGSGKTSVAEELGHALSAPTVSFGEAVRTLHPEAIHREELQRAGAEALEALGPRGLIDKALEISGVPALQLPVIWEGLRHDVVLDALQELYSGHVSFLFFLEPNEGERRERMAREAGSRGRLEHWERHATEELGRLKERADGVIAATSVNQAAERILAHIGSGH